MYHITVLPVGEDELVPMSPPFRMPEEDEEPRISFCPSIVQCLLAMPAWKVLCREGTKGILYVYRAIETQTLVPADTYDARETGEMVSYTPVKVELFCTFSYHWLEDLLDQVYQLEPNSSINRALLQHRLDEGYQSFLQHATGEDIVLLQRLKEGTKGGGSL